MTDYCFDPEHPPVEKNLRKADPQIVGDALEVIAAKHGGRLEPPDVVEEAKSPKHPLHFLFEWRDKQAAEQWRLAQARQIIRSVRVAAEPGSNEPPKIAFPNISAPSGRSYRLLSEVLNSRDLQARLLIAAEQELAAFERRYHRLLDVCELVRAARRALFDRRSALGGVDPENRPSI
jgi:hypothetical protein